MLLVNQFSYEQKMEHKELWEMQKKSEKSKLKPKTLYSIFWPRFLWGFQMLSIMWIKNATFKAVQKVTLYLYLSQGKQVKLDQVQRELRTKFPLISNGFRVPNCQLMYLITKPDRRKSEVSWYENDCGYMNSSIPKYL